MNAHQTALEAEGQKKNERVAIIVAGITGVILLIVLLIPFFYKLFPIPESEGLMASFGNVEVAGGDSENPNPGEEVNQNTSNSNSSNDQEDVTTTDNENDESIENNDNNNNNNSDSDNNNDNTNDSNNDGNDDSDNNRKINNDAIFGGGNGPGPPNPGTPGNPLGLQPLGGGNGLGDKGKGDGRIGNRKIIEKCKGTGFNSYDQGVAWVYICVKADGSVKSAEVVLKNNYNQITTITSRDLKKIAEECAKSYKYDTAPGEACGTIPIYFGQQ